MHIAIDARLSGYIRGGTSLYTHRLVCAMAGLLDGDRLTVLESRKRSETDWPPSAGRMRLLTPPHHRMEQVTLPVELLRLQPDLLHSPDFIPPFRRRCRSVITVHDLAFLRFPYLLTPESFRYYGQIRRAVRSADRIIAVSHATRRDILELLDADPGKVVVVYEAAAPEMRPTGLEETESARHELGLPDRFILFVGTLEPRKNLPVLLKAFATVWRETAVPLVIVGGKGWLYEEVFRTREQLGLGDQVRFVGQVPPGQLLYYYNCATCLVLPSLYEGFGLPVMEAMACGTPCVVSNVSSLPEVAGDAALQVDPEDHAGMAVALSRLLTDDELRTRLGRDGLARAAAFSWDRAAAETIQLYRQALHD